MGGGCYLVTWNTTWNGWWLLPSYLEYNMEWVVVVIAWFGLTFGQGGWFRKGR